MICTKWTRGLATVFLAAGLFCGTAMAQSVVSGAIAGTVEDTTGAIVPGAKVVIHNGGTNAEQVLTGDSKGYFSAPLLPPGDYKVTVTVSGFANFVQDHVVVEVGQTTELRPHMGAAGGAE